MLTSSPLLLLLVVAACFAQETQPATQGRQAMGGGDTCFLQASTITCTCRPGQDVLQLTAPYMEGSGEAEALEVRGCSSVTFAFPPLQKLHTVLVRDTASATFQEKASPLLRQLVLANVSRVVVQGPIFEGAGLETVFFDGVRVSTLPRGAFAGLSKIQNVTFRDVHLNAVQQGAVELQMVNNSELNILKSKLLSVEKSGIVVKGVTKFTMHESMLTTVGDEGLQLDAAGPVSISDSQLQSAVPAKLTLTSGASFRFVNNVWRNSSLVQFGSQLVTSGATFEVTGNTFHCACDPQLDAVLGLPMAASLLDSNTCDEGLCTRPVPMRVLASCRNQTELQAACRAALPDDVTTAPTPSGVSVSPRAAKPLSPGTNTATAIVASVTTALLLAVPAAAALLL